MCLPKVKSKAVLAALSISLICFGHAASAAIILLNESRGIGAGASVDTQSGSMSESLSKSSPGDFSDFDDLVEASVVLSDGSASAVAQQTSQISTTSILASGEAMASAELTVLDPEFNSFASGNANTNLNVSFELTTPYLFDLSGILGSSSLSGFTSGNANVSLSNDEGTFQLWLNTPYFNDFGNGDTTPFELSGKLFPDIYTLSAGADIFVDTFFDVGANSGSSNFSLDMQFAPVPIPAPLLLFASGLIGLGGMARRKKVA
jgi:hypothetical protein